VTALFENAAPLAARRGVHLDLGAFVVAIAGTVDGRHMAAVLGDGSARLWPTEAVPDPRRTPVHAGLALALARDADGRSFLTGGDDGRWCRLDVTGAVEELDRFPKAWVEHVAAAPASGLRAASAGRTVRVRQAERARHHDLDHPSTVGGLAFDPAGTRLAVAHSGGVTVWTWRKGRFVASRFVWRGSHTGVTWSPDGKFLVSTMQENALHGWRVRDKADMRMAGYPGKIRSLAWTADGGLLVTAGAAEPVAWSFASPDGPMGRQALRLGAPGKAAVRVVACHPRRALVACGRRDGSAELVSLTPASPDRSLVEPGPAPITALAFTPDGGFLAVGDEAGGLWWISLDGASGEPGGYA
jgi:WD40 repeat protein